MSSMQQGSRVRLVLVAIADALLPCFPAVAAELEEEGRTAAAQFYHASGADSDAAVSAVFDVINEKTPPQDASKLYFLLALLSSRIGTLLLCGWLSFTKTFPFIHPFHLLPTATRQQILKRWSLSRISALRQVFKAVRSLILLSVFCNTDESSPNPFWGIMGYSENPDTEPQQSHAPSVEAEKLLEAAVVDVSACESSTPLVHFLQSSSLPASKSPHPYEPQRAAATAKQIPQPEAVVECDAVVLGSGAGGGVAAAVLAEAGLRVIVVEKGRWHRMAHITRQEKESFSAMYERGGILTSEDGAVNILAGATLGGGTKVNWTASIRPPDSVISEWVGILASAKFTAERLKQSLDIVSKRMGVNSNVRHNQTNALLKQGFQVMGWDVEDYARNCQEASCSAFCNMGCKSGHKQSTDLTFLADSAAKGAKILTGCYAERVMWESIQDTGQQAAGRNKQAVGVTLVLGSTHLGEPASERRILVKCPLVIASCGSIHTPALLLRSGITCKGKVGANLRIHPALGVIAEFPESHVSPESSPLSKPSVSEAGCVRSEVKGRDTAGAGRVRPFEGGSMSVVSLQWLDKDGSGYGPVMSAPAMQPAMLAATAPWLGPRHFRDLLAAVPNVAFGVTFIRDRDSGQVTIDSSGRPVVKYWPSERDWDSVRLGMEGLARAFVAAGAKRVLVPDNRWLEYYADDKRHLSERFEEFLHQLRSMPAQKYTHPVLSAHQMGSCCMGPSPTSSACDPRGECWEVQGLYVADASVMPTCSGVNPMLSTCALAHMIATGIVRKNLRLVTKGVGRRQHVEVGDSS